MCDLAVRPSASKLHYIFSHSRFGGRFHLSDDDLSACTNTNNPRRTRTHHKHARKQMQYYIDCMMQFVLIFRLSALANVRRASLHSEKACVLHAQNSSFYLFEHAHAFCVHAGATFSIPRRLWIARCIFQIRSVHTNIIHAHTITMCNVCAAT